MSITKKTIFSMKKILIIPSSPLPDRPWYMASHYEYLIRYLSDEFFIEYGTVPYEPWDNYRQRYPETTPFMRNPNDYDLLIPDISTHWGVQNNPENGKKVAVVLYEPGEGAWHNAKIIGTTTPRVEEIEYPGKKTMSVRFGIDTDMFKPYPMIREDNLLHVGIVGSHANPRHMWQHLQPLWNIPGIRLMYFPINWINKGGGEELIERLGGQGFLDRVVTGDKTGAGIPNIYNQLDVLLRIDCHYGYSFPTLEAAACGVPVIVTDQGIDHHVVAAGGGLLLGDDNHDSSNGVIVEKVIKAV